MRADHPELAVLGRLLAGELPAGEVRAVVEHLLRCAGCAAAARGVVARRAGGGWAAGDDEKSSGAAGGGEGDGGEEGGSAAQEADDYAAIFERSGRRTRREVSELEAERLRAEALWTQLEAKSPAQRLRVVESDPAYQSWPLASLLLEASADAHWQAPARGLETARLALAVLERLREADYPGGLLWDFRARALGALAEALRFDEQLGPAGAALRAAWEALDEGTGDPLERAGLLQVQAGLDLSRGDLGGAAELLRSAAAIFRLHRDPHREGRALHRLALAVGYGEPREGVALAGRALGLIDAAREPRLGLAVRHALIWFLNDCGLPEEALAALGRARPLYRQFEETQPRLCLQWLEARICRGLGALELAERMLVAAWHDFAAAGFRLDLTLVSLDLAETWVAQGKRRRAARFVRAFHATLRRWGMHREGVAAWLAVEEALAAAAAAGRAQALTREMGVYFRQAWRGAAAGGEGEG